MEIWMVDDEARLTDFYTLLSLLNKSRWWNT